MKQGARSSTCRHRPAGTLEFFAEFAGRAGNEHASRQAAFSVLHSLHDTRGLAAFGAVGAFGRVHHFLSVCGLGNLGHGFSLQLAAQSDAHGRFRFSLASERGERLCGGLILAVRARLVGITRCYPKLPSIQFSASGVSRVLETATPGSPARLSLCSRNQRAPRCHKRLPDGLVYSSLIACMGSTRNACRAGTKLAARASRQRNIELKTNVRGFIFSGAKLEATDGAI